jgi:phage terminase large subunit-like protein
MHGLDSRTSLLNLAKLPRTTIAALLDQMSEEDADALIHDWPLWRRENQQPPADEEWSVWLNLGGRGSGKTRTGAEFVRDAIRNGCSRVALVAETAADAREVMVEGESGVLSVCWEHDRDIFGRPIGVPLYEPSKRRLTWQTGAIATTYSSERPDMLRGPQHDGAWCDEIAKWRYYDAWDQLMFGLRLGADPRCCVTTTPKPTKLLKDILKDPGTRVTRSSTFDNRAYLAPTFFRKIVNRYKDTRLGRQELLAELLEDTPGALWNRALLDATRIPALDHQGQMTPLPDLQRVVVAVDPATTSGEDANETGIIVAGKGFNDHGYVLEDLSFRASPDGWGRRAVLAYFYNRADCLVAEKNQGGEMVGHVLKTAAVSLKAQGKIPHSDINFKLVHASRGKATRAEPIAALYEQKRVHHVGVLAELEDQMCEFTLDFDPDEAGYSPDRLDATVWGLHDLMLGDFDGEPVAIIAPTHRSNFRGRV